MLYWHAPGPMCDGGGRKKGGGEGDGGDAVASLLHPIWRSLSPLLTTQLAQTNHLNTRVKLIFILITQSKECVEYRTNTDINGNDYIYLYYVLQS